METNNKKVQMIPQEELFKIIKNMETMAKNSLENGKLSNEIIAILQNSTNIELIGAEVKKWK